VTDSAKFPVVLFQQKGGRVSSEECAVRLCGEMASLIASKGKNVTICLAEKSHYVLIH